MIIVTGGAGFVGSRVVGALAGRSHEVIVADNPPSPLKQANLAGLPVADLITPARLLELAAGDPGFGRRVRAVVHMGACADTWERDARFVMESNLRYSVALLRWCLRRRIPLVYASSAAVYGTSGGSLGGGSCVESAVSASSARGLGPYARSKLLFDRVVERVLPAAPSPVAGLRLFNVYGPGERHKGRMASVVFQFHRQLHERGVIEIFADASLGAPGSQRRDLVHVDDVVSVALWFLDSGRSGVHNVGTGAAPTFAQLASMVLAHQGFGEVRYVPLPPGLRGSYQTHTLADLTKLRAAGYQTPLRPPTQGVPPYLHHLTSQPHPGVSAVSGT